MPLYGLPYTDAELLVLQNATLPGWLALAIFPKNKYTQGFALFLAVLASILYAGLMGTMIYEGTASDITLESMTTLDGLLKMFSRSDVMLTGWIHYVAFDLLAGVWICQDATRRMLPYLLILICLPFSMFAGPVGLVLYMLVRLPFSAKAAPKDKAA